MPRTESERDSRLGVLLLVALLAAYWPALTGGMVWDDDAHLTKAALRGWDGLWRIWTDVGATQQYYPLLHSAFWLEARLWGSEVLGYHLVTVLLHFANATLIVLLVRRLNLAGAWPAAFLFALHPVHVESVAWISEQKNTLSLAFYLLAALVYLRFDERRRGRDYALALALFVCALLTKTVTATLPAALLVVFWWRRGRLDWRRDVVPLLPWFVFALNAGLFTAWVERRIIGAEGVEFTLGAVERLLLSARVLLFYLWKLLWPSNLMFTYPRWTVNASDPRQWLFAVAMAVTVVASWRVRTRTRWPLALLLLFGGSLFPVLGFVNVYPFRYSYVADHFVYLASVPLTVGVAAMLTRPAPILPAKDPWFGSHAWLPHAMVAVLVLTYGLLTWRQSGTYRDAGTLYRTTLERNPDSWKEHNNLGLIYSRSMKRMAEAVPEFEAVVRLKPDHVRAHYSLGSALFLTGRRPEAEPHFRRVLELAPGATLLQTNSHVFLGQILMQQPGREIAAGEEFEAALRLAPGNASASEGLATLRRSWAKPSKRSP